MKRLMMLVILVWLILYGCSSTPEWCKQGGPQSDYESDSIDCQNKSRATGGSWTVKQHRDYYYKCMIEKGWGRCTK